MGLIKFFKRLFKPKPITMPKIKNSDFIQPLSHGYDKIIIGQELIVPEDWNALIVAKNSVLDIFSSGTKSLELGFLPNTSRALSLAKGKIVKHGSTAEVVLPKFFKCDLYFVFMGVNENRVWQTENIKLKNKNYKNSSYYLTGFYSFQIQDPEKAVNLFLIDWGKIKTGKAGKKLDRLVYELCSNFFWKKKIKNKEQLMEFDFANTYLKPFVNKTFMHYGIVILDMRIEKIFFPENFESKRYQEIFPEKDQKYEIEKVEEKNTEEENTQNADLNTKKEEKNLKKPLFFQNDLKENDFKEEIEEDNLDKKLKNLIKEVEQEDEKQTRKIPVYSYNGKNKNKAYKTADELSNCCPDCKTVNFENSDVCKNCGKDLKGDKK